MSAEWHFLVTLNERLRPLRDPVEIQNVVVQLIGEHLRASRVHYAQIYGDEFVITRSSETAEAPPFPDRGPVAFFGQTVLDACRRGEGVVVDDARTDPRLADTDRAQLIASGMAAFIAVSLTKGGQWLATFCVHATTPRHWTRDQVAVVEVTAERLWGAGERARVQEALGRQEFLRQLNDTIRPLADPAGILSEACRLLAINLHVNRVVFAQIDGEDSTIVTDYADGVPSMVGRFRWADFIGSRAGEVLQGATLIANNTSLEPHTATEREALRAIGIAAYICPLLVKGGRFVAALGIHSRVPRAWMAEEIALVQDVADRIWATLEHRKAEAELSANEERLAFLLRLNDALRPLRDPAAVQETAARLLGEHLGAGRVGYVEIDGQEYVIRCEYTHGVPSIAGRGSGVTFSAALHDAHMRGETVVVNDVASDARFTDAERVVLAGKQIAALISVRLIKDGRLVAGFGAHHPTPRTWTPTEVGLVRDVAERTWEAAERA